jgi:tRNA dimethylallyltransferase
MATTTMATTTTPSPAAAAATTTAAATAAAARAAALAGLPRVVVITGPTAVGKTAVGLEVALRMNGEVVSADSVQVYERLDVGSDKLPPGPARRGVSHHLLDVLPFTADFSAADFYSRAREALADIVARGRTPVVVGGTGLYLRWLVWGRPSTPASDPATERRALELVRAAQKRAADAKGLPSAEALSETEAWEAAASTLSDAGDPQAAARVAAERNNYYRLLRALQILLVSGGKPLSAQDLDAAKPWNYDFRCFYLNRPRIPLYERIGMRVEEMICGGGGGGGQDEEGGEGGGTTTAPTNQTTGLLQEAAMLLDAGLAPGSNMAAKAIGYRQAMEWLCAGAERSLEAADARRHGKKRREAGAESAATPSRQAFTLADLKQLALDVAQASRHLVKGQSTWFRGDPAFTWVDAGQGTEATAAEVVALASADLPPHAVLGEEEEEEGEEHGAEGKKGLARRSATAARRQLSREEQDAVKRYRPVTPLLDASPPAALAALAWANAAVGVKAAGGGGGGEDNKEEEDDEALARAERWAALARAARKRPSWSKQGPDEAAAAAAAAKG